MQVKDERSLAAPIGQMPVGLATVLRKMRSTS
jgi:hypothetical protein